MSFHLITTLYARGLPSFDEISRAYCENLTYKQKLRLQELNQHISPYCFTQVTMFTL